VLLKFLQFFAFHTIVLNEEQLLKAELPILVTPLGMVMDISEEHPLKAELPILVRLLGRVMDVSEEEP